MPKSASTFLSNTLLGLDGIQRAQLTWAYNRREQTLDVSQLARYDLVPYVSQQHLTYSSDVGALIEDFGLTPVVLTRNIFDIVASLRDHVRRESYELSMAALTPAHAALPDAELEELIADLMIPWYINFYLSWLDVDCLRANYEEVTGAPAELVARICQRAGMAASPTDIEKAVKVAGGRNNRLNVGASGRGSKISPAARSRIVSLVRHYPGVDFSPIGISAADVAERAGPHTSVLERR